MELSWSIAIHPHQPAFWGVSHGVVPGPRSLVPDFGQFGQSAWRSCRHPSSRRSLVWKKNPWIQILCENQGEATWLLTRPMKLKTLSHQLHTKGWSSPGYTNCAILSVWDGLHSRVLTMVTCDKKGSPWNYWKHQWSANSSGGLENFWKPLYKSYEYYYEYYYLYIYSYLQIINNGYWSYVDQLSDFVAAGGAHIVANFGSRWHPGKVCPRITGSLQNA